MKNKHFLKGFLIALALLIGTGAAVRVIRTTAYTRGMLQQADESAVKTYLNITAGSTSLADFTTNQFATNASGLITVKDGAALTNISLTLGSDATGDIFYRDSGGNVERLAVGSNGEVLTLAAGLPSWAAASLPSLTDSKLWRGNGGTAEEKTLQEITTSDYVTNLFSRPGHPLGLITSDGDGATSTDGGPITIRAGDGDDSGSDSGGGITISAGDGANSPGSISIIAGTGTQGATGGATTIESGASSGGAAGDSGDLNLSSGSAGGNSGNVWVKTGLANTDAMGGTAGHIYLSPGDDGSSNYGSVYPHPDDVIHLGSSTNFWRYLYVHDSRFVGYTSGTAAIGGAASNFPNNQDWGFYEDTDDNTYWLAIKDASGVKSVKLATDSEQKSKWIPATLMVARTTSPAAAGSVEHATTLLNMETWDFDASTDEFVTVVTTLDRPSSTASTLAVDFHFYSADASTDTVRWAVAAAWIAPDASLTNFTWGTEAQLSMTLGSAASDLSGGTSVNPVNPSGTPDGDSLLALRISRDADASTGGTDSSTVDAKLIGVSVEYVTDLTKFLDD